MGRELERMEAERLRLYRIACRMGINDERTLRQSERLDRIVVNCMRKKDKTRKTCDEKS